MTVSADGEDDRARARREATPDELRARAHDLFGAQVDDRFTFEGLRPGQSVVATIPIDPGNELAVFWSPRDLASKGAMFFGVFRCGPGGKRVRIGGSVRVTAFALPAFAAAVAEAMELAAEQTRAERSSRPATPADSRRGRPTE